MSRGASRRDKAPQVWILGQGTPPAGSFVALVPGEAAPLLPLDLPAGLRGAARDRVARRQISDLLGQPPDRFEVRPHVPRKGTAPVRALVVDRDARAEWIRTLAGTGCTLLLPDYLALATAEGVWTLQGTPERLLARLGPGDGFAAETALARVLLARALAETPPRAVLCRGPLPAGIAALFEAAGVALHDAPDTLPEGLAPGGARMRGGGSTGAPDIAAEIGQLRHGEAALDLLRDPAARRAALKRALGQWRAPALLALLALGAWTAAAAVETADLRRTALLHRQAAQTIAREVFLPNAPILDLRMQIAREVAARQAAVSDSAGDTPPLVLLRTAAPILLAGGAGVRRVSWQAASGLVVDLGTADFAALEALVADLRDAGLRVEIAQSVAGEDAGVAATLGIAGG